MEEKSIEEMLKKRKFVIREMIMTEITYIDRMKLIFEVFIRPIREELILIEEEAKYQFQSLENIYRFHNKYFYTLSTNESQENIESQQKITFFQMIQDLSKNNNLSIYSDYLINYEPAMRKRGNYLVSNRKFAEFLDKTEKSPNACNQSLESLLILPVQRIPRYRLLLEQLIKYTPKDHEDSPLIEEALKKICDLAMYNNEAIKLSQENSNKLMQFMMSMEFTCRLNLMDDNKRKFLKSDILLKQCRRRYKEFEFCLLSDMLLYGEITALGYFRLNRKLLLDSLRVSPLESFDPDIEKGFMIHSPVKSFKITAASTVKKNEWLSMLTEAIKKLDKKTLSREMAPVWKPDYQSTNCARCDSQFTIFFRRHHCRNCGELVCLNCSKNKLVLSSIHETNKMRVCDKCFNEKHPKSRNFNSVRISKQLGTELGAFPAQNRGDTDNNSTTSTKLDDEDYYSDDDDDDDEHLKRAAEEDQDSDIEDIDSPNFDIKLTKQINERESLDEEDLNSFNDFLKIQEEKGGVENNFGSKTKKAFIKREEVDPQINQEIVQVLSTSPPAPRPMLMRSNTLSHAREQPPPKPPKPTRNSVTTLPSFAGNYSSTSANHSPVASRQQPAKSFLGFIAQSVSAGLGALSPHGSTDSPKTERKLPPQENITISPPEPPQPETQIPAKPPRRTNIYIENKLNNNHFQELNAKIEARKHLEEEDD